MPADGAAAGGGGDRGLLTVYVDIKSPYAYLAIEPTRRLARQCGVAIDWLPLTLNIPDYLGSARLDGEGRVVEQERSAHQWRRVKYSYMDVRRYANLRGLTIRGTQKIWDSSIASIALLYARAQDAQAQDARAQGAQAREPAIVERFLDLIYPPFWRRELDIEDPAVVTGILAAAGAETAGFADYLAGPGRAEHDRQREAAEESGIFGVPFYVWQGEGFWGREHLPMLFHRITGRLPAYAADLGMAPDSD
ncbi:MAG: DsbA family protein [Sneathiellaceae bacterium]